MSMRIRDAFGVYHAIEMHLRKSPTPLTCVDLYDKEDVKKFADSVRRVSDYLGHMYRQKLLGRVAAPKTVNSQARFAYYWKNQDERIKPEEPKHVESQLEVRTAVAETVPGVLLKKPTIEIRDNGNEIAIELPQLRIMITIKP